METVAAGLVGLHRTHERLQHLPAETARLLIVAATDTVPAFASRVWNV